VDFLTTIPAIAVGWHEGAHAAYLLADPLQWPHEYVEEQGSTDRYGNNRRAFTVISRKAEEEAWQFAADHMIRWTQEAQRAAEESLRSYQQHATGIEARSINRTIADLANRVVPRPDSQEGREAKVALIQRQQRVAEIVAASPSSALAARERRLRA